MVLPAYNEEESLGPLLRRIDQAMFEDGVDYEVILMDDGSADRTVAIAEEYAQYMPVRCYRHEVNQGLGATIRDGLEIAVSRAGERDIIVAMDADNSHTPGLIRSMVRLVLEGNDVVIASRYQRGSYVRGVPFHRQLLSFGARLIFQIAFPIKGVRDYTCGYRAYRSEVLRRAFSRFGREFVSQTGFQCMVDILLKLRAMDAIFREVPLILRYDLKGGASKMKVVSTIIGTLKLLLSRRFGQRWSRAAARPSWEEPSSPHSKAA
ncbi:MAG: glycosyltransferase family 2 protein [Planctomycetota bacterium]